jgi:hypothetical protein
VPRQSGTNDGPAAGARFYRPWGIFREPAGNLFVVDSFNHTLRKGTLQSVPVPALQILLAGNQVVLAWPGAASNFVLETSTTVGPLASWTPLTNGVVSSGNQLLFTNQIVAVQAFFRLRNR